MIYDLALPGASPLGGAITANGLGGQDIFDPGMMRPYWQTDKRRPNYGKRVVTVNVGGTYTDAKGRVRPVKEEIPVEKLRKRDIQIIGNATTTLRKEEWQMFDSAVIRAARLRLNAWADLENSNVMEVPGMSKTVLEHETMSDPGEARVDMEGLIDGFADAPVYQLEGLPLPITHMDFWFSARRLSISRNTGTPLDATMAEAAARRIAETLEQTLIGTMTGFGPFGPGNGPAYGRNSTVYGYTNFPDRNTYTSLTTPTGSNPEAILANVLACLEVLYADRFYGPFMVYHSTPYTQYLDNDYARLGGNNASMTVRDRLKRIPNIVDVKRLDYLTSGYQLIFVQMTPDVARAINGMPITTLQWEDKGGLKMSFKVMTIKVPQLRADFNGRCGILHATTS